MKHNIRSYLVFTSLWYKIIMFAVLPLVLLGIQVFSTVVFRGTAIPVFVMILIMVEIMADYGFLGGIQEKGSEKIDYLKTSPRGMKVMKSALVIDLVRRFLLHAGIFGLSQMISLILGFSDRAGELIGFGELLLVIFLSYTLSVLGIFISRFTSYLWVNLLCGYIGAIAGLVILLVCTSMPVPMVLPNAALVVLGGGISLLIVKIAMLKVEGSYYDK
ncbi:MAG: hypothetical protein K2J60_07125 [Acetatifactor sp.]|nr:hypothetical protein [Acetatifactor sp.]